MKVILGIGIMITLVTMFLVADYQTRQAELQIRLQEQDQAAAQRIQEARERREQEIRELMEERIHMRERWRDGVPQGATESPSVAGIGRSYNQIMQELSAHFNMEQSAPVRGNDRVMGRTSDGTAALEIIGPRESIVQASLIIGLPSDAPEIVARNSVLLLRLLNNAVPGWTGANDWATLAIRNISASGDVVETIQDGKTISFGKFGGIDGMLILTVK